MTHTEIKEIIAGERSGQAVAKPIASIDLAIGVSITSPWASR
jgi:hypothetical protein